MFAVLIVALLSSIELVEGGCSRICTFEPGAAKYNRFDLPDILPSLCSHIIIGSAYITDSANPRFLFDGPVSIYLTTLKALKKANSDLIIVLLVSSRRGYTLDPTFHHMMKSHDGRRHFALNVVMYLRDNDYGGILLRNEFSEMMKSDKNAYVLLLKETAAAIRNEARASGKQKLLFLSTLSERTKMDSLELNADVNGICREADLVILETMMFKPHFKPLRHSRHNRLFRETPNDSRSIDYVTNHVISKGCPKEKLLIAIIPFVLLYVENLFPDSHPRHGTLFHFSNNVRYQQLCQDYLSSAKKFRLFDSTPYAAGRAVISHRTRDYILHYDDVVSVKKKVDYINEKGLAGIVVWEFIYDDSMGICFDVRVPLLKAANEKCR
ncbi:acidic mammalian chitinase-like [Biomphalaria glabrata]|uniref:Acidic mammalian chitinase-like n=1 Tax=Biomphalaria glabrata TaxID=6526 RepID=A0A9W2YJD7_BIOGL|nr:acidic mammalian chitinase-like [Biomphalaria glabrata]